MMNFSLLSSLTLISSCIIRGKEWLPSWNGVEMWGAEWMWLPKSGWKLVAMIAVLKCGAEWDVFKSYSIQIIKWIYVVLFLYTVLCHVMIQETSIKCDFSVLDVPTSATKRIFKTIYSVCRTSYSNRKQAKTSGRQLNAKTEWLICT